MRREAVVARRLDGELKITMKTTWVLLSVLGSLLAACSSTPVATQNAPAPAAAPIAVVPDPSASSKAEPASTVTTVTLPDYLDPKNSLATQRSVYYAFDDYAVGSEFSSLIETHGKYLAAHPAVPIKIEGNTDERGSAEYNLSLGQKRAEAVLRALKLYGAKDSQMEAISWGKERPKATGHDETAWAQNRRADLAYPLK